MPLFCEINEGLLDIKFSINLTKDYTGLNQSEILKNISKTLENINNVYLNAIKLNKKILGQERIHLIELVDQLIIYMVLLYDKLNDNLPENFSLESIKQDFKLFIERKINGFNSNGVIDKNDLDIIQNFNDTFNTIIKKEIMEMLKKFKNILNENNYLNNILNSLYLIINRIIYELILLRYKLKMCLIEM